MTGREHSRQSAAGDERGFTVVELLIAFTILAMAAGSLFNMFYAAQRGNDAARERDLALTAASSAAESFKKDPTAYASSDGAKIFYDEAFGVMPEKNSGGAAYVLEAKAVAALRDTDGDSDYAGGASSLVLGSDQDHKISAKNGLFGVEITLDGLPQEVDQRYVGKTVTISVEPARDGAFPKRVSVANMTGLSMAVNVFGAPDGEDPDAYMLVEASEGEVGTLFVGDGAGRVNSARYDFVAAVTRSGDGAEIARVEASKYIPNAGGSA